MYLNIVTRTSDRPKSFERCFKSVHEQTYNDINHIVLTDNNYSTLYVRNWGIEPYYINPYSIEKKTKNLKPMKGRRKLPHNIYFNYIDKELIEGMILYLDDDDYLSSPTIIEELMKDINEDVLYFFKTKIGDIYIPRKKRLYPVLNDFSGSGFIYHTKFWQDDLWIPFSGSDHHCGVILTEKIKNVVWKDITVVTAPTANFGKKTDIV